MLSLANPSLPLPTNPNDTFLPLSMQLRSWTTGTCNMSWRYNPNNNPNTPGTLISHTFQYPKTNTQNNNLTTTEFVHYQTYPTPTHLKNESLPSNHVNEGTLITSINLNLTPSLDLTGGAVVEGGTERREAVLRGMFIRDSRGTGGLLEYWWRGRVTGGWT